MNFTEIAKVRQSCRKYDPARAVEGEKLPGLAVEAQKRPAAVC